MLKRYGSILERIEERYGVPAEVLVAIWGLETDYGVNQGKYSTSARSQLWPTTVGVRKNFGPNCSMRFGPLSVVI